MNTQRKVCPICLEPLKDKWRGSPNSCTHQFCLTCLLTWTKANDQCPVDRRAFKHIQVIFEDKKHGVLKLDPIKKDVEEDALYDVTQYCEICRVDQEDNTLLSCDGCTLKFHPLCLTSPPPKLPLRTWYCDLCTPVFRKKRGRKPKKKNQRRQVPEEEEDDGSTSCPESEHSTSSSLISLVQQQRQPVVVVTDVRRILLGEI